MKTEDPVDEVWRARDKLLAEHGGDFEAYFNWLIREQEKHGRRVVRPAQPVSPTIEPTAVLHEDPPKAG